MGKKLYVGNLPYSASDSALQELFSQAGKVESVKIITDRSTGLAKGFCFIEMTNDQEATEAIKKFNGMEFEGRTLTVAEARPQSPRQGGGGFRRNQNDRRGSSSDTSNRKRW